MGKLEILECTLRDGSYTIDYQFTARDTAMIALALEDAGFRRIEIAHGLGLNASRTKGRAAESDEVYLRTTSEVLKKADWGTFFIPGIGRKKDLDLAARYGMDFVRIGTNVTQAGEAVEFVRHARKLGMRTSSNLMKSYALPPAKFARQAKIVDAAGVDVITLVDSSGGMLPKDIRSYIGALRKAGVSADIGFHGHNNFSMAVANTLVAIEEGAAVVDSSLKGIGRSAGNAQTEVLVTVLKKLGYDLGIDEFRVMDIAENLIAPLMGKHDGIDSIAITSGYAEFHSSFLSTIYGMARKYSVDPRRLIVEVSKRDKVQVPAEMAEELARGLHEERAAMSAVSRIDVPAAFDMPRDKWDRKLTNPERAGLLCRQMTNMSKKTGKQTVFTINVSGKSDDINFVYPSIQESSSYLMATCEMTDESEILAVCKVLDGQVDFVMVDDEKKVPRLAGILGKVRRKAKRCRVLAYKDNSTWTRGIEYFICARLGDVSDRKIGVLGSGDLAVKLALGFCERGASVSMLCGREMASGLNMARLRTAPHPICDAGSAAALSRDADVLIGTGRDMPISNAMVKAMGPDGLIIDATFNSLEKDAISLARKSGIQVWRTDMRAAMAGETTLVLRTDEMTRSVGRARLAGVPVVSGGFVGERGDVVVDSISDPTQVIGIADGKGSIMYGEEGRYAARLRKVRRELFRRKLAGETAVDGDDMG